MSLDAPAILISFQGLLVLVFIRDICITNNNNNILKERCSLIYPFNQSIIEMAINYATLNVLFHCRERAGGALEKLKKCFC